MNRPADRSIDRSTRAAVVALVALALTASLLPGGALAAGPSDPEPSRERIITDRSGTVRLQQQTATENATGATNDSTVRHENPDEASGEGNLTATRRWLSNQIGDSLVGCARTAQPETDRTNATNTTCETLNESFPSLSSRYAAVTRATEEAADDNASRVLNETAADQRAFVDAVAEYRSTLASYREARGANDAVETRRLARAVSRDGDRVVTVGERLTDEYGVVLGNSSIPAAAALRITETVTANVSETTDDVRTTEFDAPAIRLSTNSSEASFADPVELGGRLTAPNGTGLGNRTIAVRTPDGTLTTNTSGDGSFAVSYRPTTAPTGDARIVAEYLPRAGSQYTATSSRARVTVVSAEATLRLNRTSSSVAFGETVQVRGVLGRENARAAGVPVVVALGGVRLGTAETNESGAFAVSEPLPASVPNGTRSLAVAVAQEGRALTAEPVSTTVRVNRSTPRLFVGTQRLDAETVRVAGSMTVGELPVPGATLQIQRGNATVETVRVGESGRFGTNVSLPDVEANESTALTVAYDPPSGNLEAVDLRVPVNSAPGPSLVPDLEGETWIESIPIEDVDPLAVAVGSLALFVILLITSGAAYGGELGFEFAALRSRLEAAGILSRTDRDDGESDDEPDRTDGPVPGDGEGDDGTALLQIAQERLSQNRMDDAVVAAYSAARRQLDSRFGIEPSLTHWELLAIYGDSLDADGRAALRNLTAAYEQAAFSPAQSTVDAASDALESAGTIVGRSLVSGDGASSDD